MGPHPAVAAIRHAVRGSISWLEPGDLVLVACSGGADSLALAAAVAFEAEHAGLRAGGVTVDHGLQQGSAEVAKQAVAAMSALGLDPVLCASASVASAGDSHYPGPEAAARSARYAALDQVARSCGAAAVLLGHTLDDQAETVLLGLARGSGPRSLSGMTARSGLYLRPLLGIRREQTRVACAALDLQPWEDPHNADPAFARARVRQDLMPAFEKALGPGVAQALARTADLLRADSDVLDQMATAQIERLGGIGEATAEGWPAEALSVLPIAIRHRMLRAAALAAGCQPGALSLRHVLRMDELITSWHGQRWTDLPGAIRCERRYGRLLFTAALRSEDQGGRE